jgi:hypothetical protein
MVPVTSQLSEDGDYVGKVSDACLALSPMVPHLVVQLFLDSPPSQFSVQICMMVKCPLIFLYFNQKWNVLTNFSEAPQYIS